MMLDVPFIEQKYEWDCGIACAGMVCKFQNFTTEQISPILNPENGRLVWTIDLSYYFAKLGIRHEMYTITLGVISNYKSISFYNKYNFTSEEERVNRLFAEAGQHNVFVKKKAILLDDIVNHLKTEKQPIIVLVDASVLYTHTSSCPTVFNKREYQGHFVVVLGCDLEKQIVIFHNPGISEGSLNKCDIKTFEKARKSTGTDQDILFIFTSKNS